MNDTSVAEFRSIETLDPTTITLYPDRVVIRLGDGGAREPRVVPISELARVKVRTLFGISSLVLKTTEGRTVVADLLERSQAQSAKDQIDRLIVLSAAAPEDEAATEPDVVENAVA